jgi:tRNA G37 N-methylase Trm5
MRASKFNVADQTIVDLYCGIGYYTLPFLVHGKARFVHACEINPYSVLALKKNLQHAGISADRYCIHEGDNKETTVPLGGSADRVSLGLLPSSEEGWPLAVHVLRRQGGYLHIHENVHERLLLNGEWIDYCLAKMESLFATAMKPMRLSCTKIERVKSYAPRVYHIVADIIATPVASVST